MSKKKPKIKLPREIIPLKNPDKDFHEKWTKNRDPLNIIHPARILCLGPPNSGKGTIVKNLIIRADPEYEEIYVVHCDAEYTKEWDDIGAYMLSEIPSPDEWKGKKKTLVILDDLEYHSMNKIQKRNLDRLFGFVSTHKNVSICLCAQDSFSVPPIVRRCSNVFILWKMNDLDSLAQTARKTGMKSSNLNTIFTELMSKPHDSLWIDLTDKTPYPLRKNGYELITKSNGEETQKLIKKLDSFSVE